MNKSDELLTIQEAALSSGHTDYAVYAALKRNKLPCFEAYGRKLVRRSDWERYLTTVTVGRPRKSQASNNLELS